MNETKHAKKLLEVLNESQKSTGRCVGLEITNKSVSLSGLTKSKIKSLSALVLIRKNRKIYCKGCFDGVAYEYSSIEGLEATNNILLGIDLRSKDNNIIYYRSGKEVYGRISSTGRISSDNAMYIFWECGPYVCLIVGAYDPEIDAAIVEIVNVRDEPMKKFLKAIVRQLLSLTEIESEEEIESFDLDDDSEEDMDHESWDETNDDF